jgi:hypothetical protein
MFKIKLLKTHNKQYAELDQPNPLRWRIMHRKGDELVSQSSLIKCKDFFNDVVAWKKAKHAFIIYDFKNKIKFNKEGLYVHLTEVGPLFIQNMSLVIDRLEEDLKVNLCFWEQEDGVVVLIPHKVFSSTYYISLLSMLIRLCNYNVEYKSWDDFFDAKAPLNTIEGAFTKQAKKFTHKNGFKLLTKYRKLWYNSSNGWNSASNKPLMASVIHNNGVCDWVRSMEAV